jgi:hypothetical protein
VAGDYSQDGGLIVIEIAGPSAFDILDVTGAVMLDNVLIRFVFLAVLDRRREPPLIS